MLSMNMTGGWGQVRNSLAGMPLRIKRAQQRALQEESQYFRGKILEGLTSQAPGGQSLKPLSPLTLATRAFRRFKSTNALIERGDMMRGIKIHKIDGDTIFVGIRDTDTNSEGRNLLEIAKVHEHGFGPRVIKMTPKMMKFLAMVFRKAGLSHHQGGKSKGYIVITIPARPFLAPVFEKYGRPELVERRMEQRVQKLILGAWA